jgi:ElaB/YqjD/DUF883 family membrane-anchored ribosome-binding protein
MQNASMQGSTPSGMGSGQDPEAVLDRASAKLSNLTDSAQQTIERFSEAASEAATRLGDKGRDFWEAQGPALDKARSYMREHPVATIGIAVAVGLVLSKLLSRR